MQRRLAAQKDEIGLPLGPCKEFEPLAHRIERQSRCSMLRRIDVAVATGKIAGGEEMKKDIALPWLEAHGAGNRRGAHGFSASNVCARV